MENTNNNVATESLFQVLIGEPNENLPGFGYVIFQTRELADSFIETMMKGCFYKNPFHGLPELQLVEDVITIEGGKSIKSTLLKTVLLGNEEEDAKIISDKPEVIYDLTDSDPGNHPVEIKPEAPKVTVVLPFDSLR